MQPEQGGYVATSIVNAFIGRMRRTHERRRISVFSGPPGIGKTTAVEHFRAEYECNVVVVTVPPGPKGGLKVGAALQLVLEAIYDAAPHTFRETTPSNYVMLRGRMFAVIGQWVGLEGSRRERMERAEGYVPPHTIIFDEAQNLSREAIDVVRFLSDPKGGYSPLPIGLIFVGNNEFILKSTGGSQSVLSAAVADRALYTESLSYKDVSDDDLALFFEAGGLVDPAALQLVIRYFGAGRVDRSFRRAADLLDVLSEESSGEAITADVVRNLLSLAA
jgi:hypothetical protein